jgi:hypothetical protein
MIKSKTIPERIQDICNRSGLSADIVKRVLSARADSIMDDLMHGMRVVDYGVCSLKPEVTKKIGIGGMKDYVSVTCSVSPKIIDTLNSIEGYKVDDTDDDRGSVRVQTLHSFE